MARKTVVSTEKQEHHPVRKSFHLEWKNTSQKIAYMAFEQHDLLFLSGPAGSAKTHLAVAFAVSEIINKKKKKIILSRPIVEAGEKLGFLPGPQPLDAKILTPNGWTIMGKLKVGDKVIGRNGKPTNIIKIIPNGKKMVYKIFTTDNTCTEACADHLWFTKTAEDRKRNYAGSVKSTMEILSTLTKNDKINHFLPRVEPVEFTKTELSLSPYVLGVLLGDGCITNSIGFGNLDLEIVEKVKREISKLGCTVVKQKGSINYNIKMDCFKSKKTARKIRITNTENDFYKEYDSISIACIEKSISKSTLAYRCRNNLILGRMKYEFLKLKHRWTSPIKNILENIGLLGKKSSNKFIPDIYKFSSIEDRIELLRGLMDTDGTVKKNGECSYTTTSIQLAEDVIELIRSLGGRAVLRKRIRVNKTFIGKREILSKKPSYEFNVSLPASINPFYISRKANRFQSKYIHGVGIRSIEPICEKEVQCILLDNEEHLYITDQYIVTHNTFEEKVNPYLRPIFDCLDTIVGIDTTDRSKVNHSLEIVPIAYMRGRAEPLDNLIPTPDGLKRMGDLEIGDLVFGSNGNPIPILGVYPQGKKSIYKITFSDNCSVLCSEEHLWTTKTLNEKRHNKGFTVKETKVILKSIKNKHGSKNHEIPVLSSCVKFNCKEIPINPYLLGVLLGDGCFSTNAAVTVTNIDDNLLCEVEKSLPKDMVLSPDNNISYRLSYNLNNGVGNPIKKGLRSLGLFRLKSNEKFVPDCYKFNHIDVRLEVLRGLMDTDGWVGKHKSGKSKVQYYSTSNKLAKDVVFLVQSLGGIAHLRKRSFLAGDNHIYKGKLIKHVQSLYVVDVLMPNGLNPFKCETKKNVYCESARVKRLISNIEYVGEMDCQCILVDSEDHLYLTDNFIVTHNTFHDSVIILDEAQNATEEQLKLAMTRLGLNSKMIITGDSTQSDLKGEVFLPKVLETMKNVQGIGIVEFNETHIVRHALVADILAAWPK